MYDVWYLVDERPNNKKLKDFFSEMKIHTWHVKSRALDQILFNTILC